MSRRLAAAIWVATGPSIPRLSRAASSQRRAAVPWSPRAAAIAPATMSEAACVHRVRSGTVPTIVAAAGAAAGTSAVAWTTADSHSAVSVFVAASRHTSTSSSSRAVTVASSPRQAW